MRKFSVNVNGTKYEVEVEEIDAATAAKAAEANKAEAAKSAPAGEGVEVKAQMPGNILQVNIKPGDVVKEGQQLMVLEAMKMENEILAPVSGKITVIAVAKGSTVQSGSLLCTIA